MSPPENRGVGFVSDDVGESEIAVLLLSQGSTSSAIFTGPVWGIVTHPTPSAVLQGNSDNYNLS